MRKNRILGLLLSSVMLLTSLVIPVYAATPDMSEDFEGYTAGSSLGSEYRIFGKYVDSTNTNIPPVTVESIDGTKAIKLNKTTDVTSTGFSTFGKADAVTSGKIGIRYSIKYAPGITTFVKYLSKTSREETWLFLNNGDDYTQQLLAKRFTDNVKTAGWYNSYVVLDLDNGTSEGIIWDNNNKVISQQSNIALTADDDGGYSFGGIYVNNWAGSKGTNGGEVYFDNLSITSGNAVKTVDYIKNSLIKFDYVQDFESGESALSDFTLHGGYSKNTTYNPEGKTGTPQGAIAEVNGSKVLKVEKELAADNIMLRHIVSDVPVTTGKVSVQFSMFADPNLTSFFRYQTSRDVSSDMLLYFVDGSTYKVANQALPGGVGRWMNFNIILDLDNSKATYLVTDEYDNIVGKNYEGVALSNAQKSFCGFSIQSWKNGGSGIDYVDNIRVSNVNIPSLVGIENALSPVTPLLLPVHDVYSSYSDTTALRKEYTVSNDTDKTSVALENGKLVLNGTGTFVYKNFTSSPITKGKIKISSTIIPYDNSTLGFINDSNPLTAGFVRPTFYFKNGGVYKFVTADWASRYVGNYTAGNKYRIEATIDMDAKTMDIKMTGINDGTVIESSMDITNYTSDKPYPINSITAIGFANYSKGPKTEAENLDIEYVQNGAPTLTEDNVKFYNDDTEISKDAITPNVNKIVLDFGDIMDPTSFADKVTLKKSTGEDVKIKGSITGSTYTVVIPNRLDVSAQYELNVSGDVKNAVGTAMGIAYNMTFNTNGGTFDAVINLKTSDGSVVITEKSQLAQGQTVKTEITFENSTCSEVNAVALYSYYAGNKLVKVSLQPVGVTPADKKGTITQNHTVESLDGITKVKVMLWDNFDKLKPLAEFIELQ